LTAILGQVVKDKKYIFLIGELDCDNDIRLPAGEKRYLVLLKKILSIQPFPIASANAHCYFIFYFKRRCFFQVF
jgi:hypothetical protein